MKIQNIRQMALMCLLVCSAILVFVSLEKVAMSSEPLLPSISDLSLPLIDEVGTYFEVDNNGVPGAYIIGSAMVHIALFNQPDIVDYLIEAADGSNSTTLIIGNLQPSTIYYMYEDGYTNGTTLTTDIFGSYTYVQDTTQKHHVIIQPTKGTIYIPDDESWGIYDPITNTYTLKQDIYDSIEITRDGTTLDLNGYNVTGSEGFSGIYFYNKTGVTIKNGSISGFPRGIFAFLSHDCTIENNLIYNNSNGATSFLSSNINTKNNRIYDNNYGIFWYSSSNVSTKNDHLHGNNYGIVSSSSPDVTISNNSLENNSPCSIMIFQSPNSIVSENRIIAASPIFDANVYLRHSPFATVSRNIMKYGGYGILLEGSSDDCIISNNDILTSGFRGLTVVGSSRCIISGNSIEDNGFFGIALIGSNENRIYYNNFGGSTYLIASDEGYDNLWDAGYPYGGNYWDDYVGSDEYSGAGPDEPESDGIGDTPYMIDVQRDIRDNYPLMTPLTRLIKKVENLINSIELTQPPGNGLIGKLEEVIRNLNKETPNRQGAYGQLGAFINQVNAHINSGKLSPEEGQVLIDAAEEISSRIFD